MTEKAKYHEWSLQILFKSKRWKRTMRDQMKLWGEMHCHLLLLPATVSWTSRWVHPDAATGSRWRAGEWRPPIGCCCMLIECNTSSKTSIVYHLLHIKVGKDQLLARQPEKLCEHDIQNNRWKLLLKKQPLKAFGNGPKGIQQMEKHLCMKVQ